MENAMLENGMIVGAAQYDPQQRPLPVCPVCREACGELVQTEDGWMCPTCEDEYIDRNAGEFAPQLIAQDRASYLEGLYQWLEPDERLSALENMRAYLERTYPGVVEEYQAAYLENNRFELRELARERLEGRYI